MEKHHKLRRPAGSSIHGCNICGKEGHQAAHCSNGTVDWGSKWPKDAWSLEEPLWYAEPQYAVVGKVARDWVAKRKRQAAAAAAAASGEAPAEPAGEAGEGAGEGAGAAGGGTAAALPASAPAGGPPSAWQTFYDAYGRPYYFNQSTGVTSWELPTVGGGAPATAAPGAPAAAAAGAPA